MHRPSDNKPLSEAALVEALAELGKRVRDIREQRHWSQPEASRRSGVSQGEWSRIERGERNPTTTTLLRLQHALHVESVETLFGDHPSRRIGLK